MKKFIMNLPREEGDIYENHAFFIFGRCYKQSTIIKRLPDGTALDHDRVEDGWYICFNTPFSKKRTYISTTTFENEEGMCSYRLLFRIRKIVKNNYYSFFKLGEWVPTNPGAHISEQDPYLTALSGAKK